MNNDAADKVEGEGSYSAARKYNEHLEESVERGDIDSGAAEALRAVEGPEGQELRRAEERAKQGPTPSAEPDTKKPVIAP